MLIFEVLQCISSFTSLLHKTLYLYKVSKHFIFQNYVQNNKHKHLEFTAVFDPRKLYEPKQIVVF